MKAGKEVVEAFDEELGYLAVDGTSKDELECELLICGIEVDSGTSTVTVKGLISTTE